jgi:hypothetical protein
MMRGPIDDDEDRFNNMLNECRQLEQAAYERLFSTYTLFLCIGLVIETVLWRMCYPDWTTESSLLVFATCVVAPLSLCLLFAQTYYAK